MDIGSVLSRAWDLATPSTPPDQGWWSFAALLVALAAVVAPPIWRLARLAVTIVHELGHAGVGILMGRRFTGFVVSPDMSGHAITVGRSQGIGRVASAWAGYPMPALLGALLIQVAFGGWASTALAVALVLLILSLVFSRSLHTVTTVLATAVIIALVWWFGGPLGAAALVLGGGVLLLLGAWRHLGAVMRSGRRQDDPQQLAQLTGVPAWAWIGTYLLVLALCSWWAAAVLLRALG
ncbi:hypothetical protein DEO23_02840 [Brachybacterium endophyticum]|uniref:M50 family peptidase n=1 Tax=Brachybacterium endophyticum TaxID=2182385 RepID=A0A2U2RNY2_9MICO|nr:M50 family metallopeptidase [Brachybacterium endophyticum]PWH07582.1 hypothetical protein DEO23_02840 [Brachybacterium endophyticum]